MSDANDEELPAIKLNVTQGYDHLTSKTMHAFDYVYQHYYQKHDWFIKVDDDSYVILENLRYLLSSHKPSEPIFFGHRFRVLVKQGYFSGGGGYVLSREALRRFGNRTPNQCLDDGGAEDVAMGSCMQTLGVSG